MANQQDLQGLTPDYRVRINGSDLPAQALADLVALSVQLDVAALSMFTLRLVNWDMDQRKMTWSDDVLFALGSVVEIQMGYVNHLATLLVGEITGIEPEMGLQEMPMVTVRGYDRRHRLLRGQKTRTFRQMKDSDMIRQLAGDGGLSAQVTDSQVLHDYVVQHNQSDLEFMLERAQRIGYEVVVEDKTLYFRPPAYGESEGITLTHGGDLLEFYLRLSSLQTTDQLSVRGWDPGAKKALVATVSAGSEGSTMAGTTSGPAAMASAFGQNGLVSTAHPVATQSEADQIAQGRFQAMALGYIMGEGLCSGRTDLRAGMVIKLVGLGQQFSGRYYVTAVTHTFTPAHGYRTAFIVRRNAT